jgi:hypothetical protein
MGCTESKCKTAKWPAVLYYSDVYRPLLVKCGIRFIKCTYKWVYIEFPSEFQREKRDKKYFRYRGKDPNGNQVVITVYYDSNGTLLSFNVTS